MKVTKRVWDYINMFRSYVTAWKTSKWKEIDFGAIDEVSFTIHLWFWIMMLRMDPVDKSSNFVLLNQSCFPRKGNRKLMENVFCFAFSRPVIFHRDISCRLVCGGSTTALLQKAFTCQFYEFLTHLWTTDHLRCCSPIKSHDSVDSLVGMRWGSKFKYPNEWKIHRLVVRLHSWLRPTGTPEMGMRLTKVDHGWQNIWFFHYLFSSKRLFSLFMTFTSEVHNILKWKVHFRVSQSLPLHQPTLVSVAT